MRIRMYCISASVLVWFFILPVSFAQESNKSSPVVSAIPETYTPAPAPQTAGPPAKMQEIYEQVKTPYKYGIILKGENNKKVDCPAVFSHGGKWYMTYIVFDGTGYETWLAQSENETFCHWKPLGRILRFKKEGWDALQAAGHLALQDTQWGGSYQLQPFDGKYWMSYIGGSLRGYETDPLAIGIAYTADPSIPAEWTRLPHPVLHRDQPDVRYWEKLTQYKGNIIWDHQKTLGAPFVMFYNAKTRKKGYETIGMAISDDMKTWRRFGVDPVLDAGSGISGDPQVVRIGNLWVMFYFGAFWKPKAFDTFACSYDLVHWTKWDGPHLVEPSEPWDEQYAHKPCVIFHNGVVYHFYNAVGNQGRVIALAASKPLQPPPL